MDLSKFLGKSLGLYLVIVSTAMLTNIPRFHSFITNLSNEPSSMFIIGFVTLILGIMLVVSHSIWEWDWRVLITLIGWFTLFKAICILFCPDPFRIATVHFVQSNANVYIASGVDFILGLALLYFSFRSEN